MSASNPPSPFASKELFRFARLRPWSPIDLRRRATALDEAREILDADDGEQVAWAEAFLGSDRLVSELDVLSVDYFAPLSITDLPTSAMPGRKHIADVEAYRTAVAEARRSGASDRERCILSLLACRILGQSVLEARVARLLAFIDSYAGLEARIADEPYPPVILRRTTVRTPVVGRLRPADLMPAPRQRELQDLRQLADIVAVLTDAQDRRLADARRRLAEYRRLLSEPSAEPSGKTSGDDQGNLPPRRRARPSPEAGGEADLAAAKERAARRAAARATHRSRRDRLDGLKNELRRVEAEATLHDVLEADGKVIAQFLKGRNSGEVSRLQEEGRTLLATYDIKPGGFCETYGAVVSKIDMLAGAPEAQLSDSCFAEHPDLAFQNSIRILGTGKLIRVDEEFQSYTPGEISYIETILAGEIRRREVRTEKSFETLLETVQEDVSELTSQSDQRSAQELKSEIETELASRFSSDLSSAFNASGGGTIGVVDVEGGATVNAGVGIGFDTSSSTSSSSEFAQEILQSAIERTKRTVAERRVSRSHALTATLNYHEINNTVGDVRHRNGVYCFLDKHILIRETTYGVRVFLLANVALPGKNLLCQELARISLSRQEIGPRPVFDINPDDVQPSTYKALVARFAASNVEPPPPPTRTLGRAYKTDNTNANVEQVEFKPEKVAELLVPYFKTYKRHLIAENIVLPEGYAVHRVVVTVNHGGNGISIPAHLPLSIAGASFMMLPSIAAGAAYGGLMLPVSLWYITYLASPLLHYNADSSNVTVSVGNESFDSPYYFFQPDFLIREIFGFFGNFSIAGPHLLHQIEDAARVLADELAARASQVPQQVADIIDAKIRDLVNKLRTLLNSITDVIDLNPFDNAVSDVVANINALAASAIDLTTLQQTMDTLFAPLQAFIDTAFELLDEGLQEAMSDLFGFLETMFDNSQNLLFLGSAGLQNELPISINAVTVRPGVTINVNVCLRRTDEAMDRWRIETFGRLYQGFMQQMAEYEARSFAGPGMGMASSPGNQRAEEHRALKELVLHTLNNYHGDQGNTYTIERMNLFENAIDWANMSFRLFNYGPSGHEVLLEKHGAFSAGDERRRAFLTALWAQVIVPLQPHERLESQVGKYFIDGSVDFDGDLSDEELTALYTDLVLQRALVAETPQGTSRPETLPTDLVVIVTDDLASQLPVNAGPQA